MPASIAFADSGDDKTAQNIQTKDTESANDSKATNENASVDSNQESSPETEEEPSLVDNLSSTNQATHESETSSINSKNSEANLTNELAQNTLVGNAQMQDLGWISGTSTSSNSTILGRTGLSKRLETISLKLDNSISGSINYSVHVQDYGWMTEVSNGSNAGTVGKSKRIEAVKIYLTGAANTQFDIFYRVHVQDYGWLTWTSNGNPAGTTGLEKRIEALEVILLPKGEVPSDYTSSENSFIFSILKGSAHVQYDGTTFEQMISTAPSIILGQPNSAKRVEAISLDLDDALNGRISYSAFVQDYGWMNEVSNGTLAGTTGKEKRMEAFKATLTGNVGSNYELFYRAFVQDYGWLGWAKSGNPVGSQDLGKRIEAIEITVLPKGDVPNDYNSSASPLITAALSASGHVQKDGWIANGLDEFPGNLIIGTTGQSKRLEAISLKLDTNRLNASSIVYSAQIQDIGWTNNYSDGEIAGTTGQSKRLEAVKINLTGDAANQYDIHYRAHVPNIGWMNWAKNGEPAGTEECSIPIEAIEISILPKGSTAPVSTGLSFLNGKNIPTSITYGALSGTWYSGSNGSTAGTTGQSKATTGIRMQIDKGSPITGGIEYSAHVSNTGWLGYVSNGSVSQSGTNRVQAIKVRLTGELSRFYDVYYRAHVANYGWMGWTKNGNPAGTTGLNKNMEAFQVVLVAKGAPAPGSTANSFSDENGFLGKYWSYINKAQSYSSRTNYLILVDRGNHKVVVFRGSKNNWSLQYYWSCVTGAPGTPTITGTFSTPGFKRPSLSTDSRAIYCTQIWGGYFFHSILASENELGKSLSHGCIRLSYTSAQWIYNNIYAGTTVVIYN